MLLTVIVIVAVIAVLGLIFAVRKNSRSQQDTSEPTYLTYSAWLTYPEWKKKVKRKLEEE